MKTFLALRFLAVLLRIARALEKSNEMARFRMKSEGLTMPDSKKPKKTEISVPTVQQWNENFLRERDEQE